MKLFVKKLLIDIVLGAVLVTLILLVSKLLQLAFPQADDHLFLNMGQVCFGIAFCVIQFPVWANRLSFKPRFYIGAKAAAVALPIGVSMYFLSVVE